MRPSRPPGREREGGPVTTPGRPLKARSPQLPPQGPAAANGSGRACEAPGCGLPLPPGRRRFCSELCRVRGQRAERRYEPGEFGAAAVRMVAALARRVGASDAEAFTALWELRGEADRACAAAIDQLRAEGFTWSALGAAAGLSGPGLCQWRKRRPPQPGLNGSFKPGSP